MRLKRYIYCHVIFLAAVLVFAVYGFVTTRLLPFPTFHCFMHDVLHLYCPFCGGTRAFMALLRLDLLAMVLYNPAVVLATLVFIFFDLRALILILRHREGALFPRFLSPLAVVWFSLYTVLRNALAFFRVDPIGDIAPYWQARITVPIAVLSTCLLLLSVLFLLGTLYLPQKLRRPSLWLLPLALVLLTALLYQNAWLLLLLPLPLVVYILLRAVQHKKTPSVH